MDRKSYKNIKNHGKLVKEPSNKSSALEKIGDVEPLEIEEYIKEVEKARNYEGENTEVNGAVITYKNIKEEYLDTLDNHNEYEKNISLGRVSYKTDKENTGTYGEYNFSYKDPFGKFIEACEEASEKSKMQAEKEEIEGKKNLILRKQSLIVPLVFRLSYYFNAYNVHKGLSKINLEQKIGSEDLNIINSGILEDGFQTTGFDSEGTRKQKTILLEEGKVKSYLHNDYTANIYDTKSTGNSHDFLDKSNIKLDNLVIEPGKGFESEGIIVEGMLGNLDYPTGDYSFEVPTAWTEDGKGVKNFVFQGNLFEDLKELRIGKEKKKQRPGIRSPDLMLEGKDIQPK